MRRIATLAPLFVSAWLGIARGDDADAPKAPPPPSAGRPEADPGLPADLVAAQKVTAARLAELKMPANGAKPEATRAIKAIRDLLEERKKTLDLVEAEIRAQIKAESPAGRGPDEAELGREIAAIEAILAKAKETPGSLLPEGFRDALREKPTEPLFAKLKEAITSAQDVARDAKGSLEALRAGASSKGADASAARNEREAVRKRLVELDALRGEVDAALASAAVPEARELARDRRINLEWEARLNAERLQAIDARIAAQKGREESATLRLKLKQLQEEVARGTLDAMQSEYRAAIRRQEIHLEILARQQKDKAALSGDPLEKFKARRTAELADLATSILKEERGGAEDPALTPEEQARLADRAEQDFVGLKKLVENGRSSGLAATRLTATFRRLASERASIRRKELALATAYTTRYETLLTGVELDLLDDEREDRAAIESLVASLSASRHAEARALAEKFEGSHLSLLNRRRIALTTLATQAEATRQQVERRLRIIDEEHAFLRTHIFWVRDAVPVGPASISQASIEAPRLLRALAQITGEAADFSTWGRFSTEFLVVAAGLASLPYGIYRGRKALRHLEAAPTDSSTVIHSFRSLLLAASIASLWPAYLGLAAYAARVAPWPRPVARLWAFILGAMAAIGFVASSSRLILGPGGWAETSLQLRREVAGQVRLALSILAVAVPFLLLPDWIIQNGLIVDGDRPVSAPVLGRSALLAFEIVAFVVAARLMREKSPLVQWLIASSTGAGAALARRHRLFAYAGLAGFGGMIALDAQGYAFSAKKLWACGLQASMLAAGSAVAYRLLVRAIDGQAWRWLRHSETARAAGDGQEAIVAPGDLAARLRRLAAWVVPICGLMVAAWLWNLNLALFETVAAQPIWPGAEKGLNVGDASLALFAATITAIVWRHLGTFFAVVVFPRMVEDPGLHFAILSLSRYSVLAVGGLVTLSAVHLGLDQIKFVLAALGVGLGFGLQEIVSNFISGIILLVERPIRVGDVVTVAGMSGKVDKIQIRATTIINAENQSMIVPNREFITGSLINWTHKDRVVRVSIPVRVAFGTDPEAVSEILLAIARDDADVLRNPVPNALMDAFADSWLAFNLNVYVPDPGLSGRVKHRLCGEIQRRFEAAKIVTPVPAREYRVRALAESSEISRVEPARSTQIPGRVDPAAESPAPHIRPAAVAIPRPAQDCHRGVDD